MIFKSDIMNINFKDAVSYLSFKELDKYNFIKHGYMTRLGGVSEKEYKSLNFGFNTGDSKNNVEKNYDIFCNCMNIKKNNLVLTSQVHEDNICVVSKKNINLEGSNFTRFESTDGLITDNTEICLMTFHADCAVVYMIDINKKIIGLAHAGWRGTVKNIAGKLVQKFLENYNSQAQDIIVAIGPSIGPCCFEVDMEVLEKFRKLRIPETYIHKSENHNKISIDLLEVNKNLVIKSGIKEENIFKSDICTMCNHDLLFSHRATHGKRGTTAAFLTLNNI